MSLTWLLAKAYDREPANSCLSKWQNTNISSILIPRRRALRAALLIQKSTRPQAGREQTRPSQQAAQEVLAGKATVVRSTKTDFDALGAALGRGAGVPGNPIVVTLNERKFH